MACGKDETGPNEPEDIISQISKSSKRGLAYDLKNDPDLDTLKSGISWWYNWYFKTDAPENYNKDYQMEFIPMLWGGNKTSDYSEVKEFIINHEEIKYLLVLNEPNLVDQANKLPFEAAADWVLYEKVKEDLAAVGRTIYLVGPSMNWGTMENFRDPIDWLDAFYLAYQNANSGTDPQIDYLAFHWYDYGLEAQLDRLQKYGKKIWITEMANWNANINSFAKQRDQMEHMVSVCENREDVFRYAWFIGRGFEDHYSNLFNSGAGELNDLGRFYLNLPYTE